MTPASVLTAGLACSGLASALTLDNSKLEANTVYTMSPSAYGASTAAGVTFTPLGNMTKIRDVTVVDPETGLDEVVPQFNEPVTKADISIGWDFKIAVNWGLTSRSALKITRSGRSVITANFKSDFKQHIIYADLIIAGRIYPNTPLYSFEDATPLSISFKNLVLEQTQRLHKMVMRPEARGLVADALQLSAPLRATLETQEWGTLDVKVTSYKRRVPLASTVPFSAADFADVP